MTAPASRRAYVWRSLHRRAIYRLRDAAIELLLYDMGAADWWLELGGPPTWPLVDLARAQRLSCGGLRFRFASRAEALRFAAAYLELYAPAAGGGTEGAHGAAEAGQ